MDRLLDAERVRVAIAAQPASETDRLAAALRLEEAVRTACRSLTCLERRSLLAPDELAHWTGLFCDLRRASESSLSRGERERVAARAAALVDQGFEESLARELSELGSVVLRLGVLSLAARTGAPLANLLELHATVAEKTRIRWLLERTNDLDRRDSWERVAAEGLHLEMLEAQTDLCAQLVEHASPAAAVEEFLAARADAVDRLEETVRRIEAESSPSLAALAVLAHHIRRLVA
jgi:NAD-specific glutamate dehydrogenase